MSTAKWVLALALVAGCTVQLKTPPLAEISCATNSDCPKGFYCQTELKRCLADATREAPKISLRSANLAPSLVGVEQPVTVTLSFDGALHAPPEVVIDTPTPTSLPFERQDGEAYVFSGRLPSTLPDASYGVSVTYTDTLGRVASRVSTGVAAVVDFTPPSLVGLVANNTAPLATGAEMSLVLTVNEPLAQAPVVTLDDDLTITHSGAAPSYTYSAPVTDSLAEGNHTISIVLVDAAGNERRESRSNVWTIDHTPPALAAPATLAGSPASTGDQLRAVVRFDEPLNADPVVELVDEFGAAVQMQLTRVGVDYVASVTVDPLLHDGHYTVSLVSFSDLAGNAGATRALGQVAVDTQAPTLTPISVGKNALTHTGTTSVTFSASEDVGVVASGQPRIVVAVGEIALSCTRTQNGQAFDYSCPIDASLVASEGPRPIVVTAVDAAGNVVFAPGPNVLFDYTPPGLAVPPNLSRSDFFTRAQLSSTEVLLNRVAVDGSGATSVAVTFVANETLAEDPTFSLADVSIESSSAGGFYFVRYTPSLSVVDGQYELSATLTDLAGNTNEVALGIIHLDTTPPLLDALEVAKLTYYRSLWDHAPAGTPDIRLDVSAPLEADATLFVYGGDSYATGGIITSADLPPTATSIGLPPINRTRVYVALRDRAGNLHGNAPRLVRKGSFVSTLVADQAPPDPINPQLGYAVDLATAKRAGENENALVQSLGPNLDTADGIYTAISAKTDDVIALGAMSPAPRKNPALALRGDEVEMVMFGGRSTVPPFSLLGDTWLYADGAWRSGPGGPPARSWAGLSRRTGQLSRGRVVLFGGSTGAAGLCDTWRYDGTTWSQQESDDSCTCGVGACPAARFAHGQTFADNLDPSGEMTLVTGGVCAGDTTCNDARVFGGDPLQWRTMTLLPHEAGVGQRAYHALIVANAGIQQVFSFGGGSETGGLWSANADLWSWDGSSWTHACSSSLMCETASGPAPCACTQSPPARFAPTFYYDEAAHRLMLLGGTATREGTDRLRDVWAYDLGTSDWQRVHDFGACVVPGPGCEWQGSDFALLPNSASVRAPTQHLTYVVGGEGGMLGGLPFAMVSDHRQHKPALQVQFDLSALGLQAAPQSMRIEAVAAADCEYFNAFPPSPPTPRSGGVMVEALEMSSQNFVTLGSMFGNPLEWQTLNATADPLAAFYSQDNKVWVRLTPEAPSGLGAAAQLRVDTLRAVFDYQE